MPWGSTGSIWAEFGLDYTKFQQGVQQVTQELVKLDGKYREAAARMEQTVNAAMEQLGASIYAASAKQQLLGESFDGNAAKARALEQALDQLLSAGVSPTNDRVQELAQQLQSVRSRMEQAAEAAQQMARETQSVADRVRNLAQEMSQLGSQMSIGLTLPLTALTGFATKAATDFESAMAKVWTIADMTRGELGAVASQIEDMSTTIPQSAKQLAEGLYDAIGSGITDVAEAMQVLEVAAKAGQAGVTSTAVAMDALTSTINAYGMEASQAGELADVMFRAMDRGKLTFEEIAGNLGQVISTAAVAGVQFEEVAAAFATLTKGGVGAAEAATAINQAILTIIQPSEQAAEYAKSLGIEFNAAALASKGLAGVMEDVYQATGGNIEAMTALFNNVRALKGALGLTRNEMADYNSDLEAMSTAAGAAERAFEKQMQTSAAQAQLFKNEIANLGRAFGSELLPMLNDAMERIKPLIQAFTDLPEGAQRAAVVFATVTAAIGPLMAAVGGLVNLLTGPAGWIVAVTAVGSAIYGLVSSVRDLEGQIDRQISSARDAINEAMSQADAYERQASALDDLIAEYEELEGKPDKSQEEHERLRQVIDEIVRLAPTAVTGFDDMGNALIGNAEAAKKYREQLWNLRNDQLQLAAMRVQYELPRHEETIRRYGAEFEQVSKDLVGVQEQYFKMRQVIFELEQATTNAARDTILDAAFKTGVFSPSGAPPATQYAAIEKQYNSLYERYTTLAAVVEKATAAVIELKKAQEELEAHQKLKPGETLTSAGSGSSKASIGTGTGTATAAAAISEWQAFTEKVQALSKDAYGALQKGWADIEQALASTDPAVKTWGEARQRALLKVITDTLVQSQGDWTAAADAASIEVKSGFKSIREQFEKGTKETEFQQYGEKLKAAGREAYGALIDEWDEIAAGLASDDPVVKTWATTRAAALTRAMNDAIVQTSGTASEQWAAAAAAAAREFESGYESVRRKVRETVSNDEIVRNLVRVAERSASLGDWSYEQQAEAIQKILDAETMSAALREELEWKVALAKKNAAEAAAKAAEEAAMREFQHKVAMGDLVGADAQIAELERIKDAYAGTTDEIWRIEEQIYQLRESKRSQAVRNAYEQFQEDVRLYDLSAQTQAEYLQRLLNDATLNVEERKKLAGELALVQKQAAKDVADYNRRVNDAWNKYYLDSGMKTRAQQLEEEEAAAYARLAEALRTGKDVEAAEVALAQAQLALRQQDRKDAEERHQFLVGMGALTLEAQLEQVQAWLAMEVEGSAKWRELKLEEKSLLTRLRTEMFEEFRAAQDYSQPLSEIFREQADWLRENVLLAKGLALSSDERLKTESQVYDLMLKSFGAAKQEQQWTPTQEKANLGDYVGAYATNADLKLAYKQLELDVEARAAEEEAKIRDKTFKDALAAAEDALAVTEKNAEKEKAVFNRVMDERLAVAERTEAAIAAINQRNAVYDFRIQQEAAKRAQEDADRRVALALKEADAKLDAQVWGITEYRAELDRLLRDEVNMSTAAADKIEDKRRELWTKEQTATRKAMEAGWQSEIDAEVAKWEEKLKLEKNGSEAQAAIAREATKALQAELDKRLAAENITEGQKVKLQKAIGDFDFQAKDKSAAAKREAWDQEVSDHIDAIRRQVETEKSLGYDAAAKNLRDYLEGRLAAKNITYSKERDLEKLALDYEAKARAQAQKDNEDLWDKDVAGAIDRSRKRIDIAKAEAKAIGASTEQAYRDEAANLQKILDERIKSGSITLSAAEKINQEIAKLNHEAELAALEASSNTSDQAVAAKLREVDAKLSLDKNYAVAILDLQEYLNDETVKLTALGRERLKTTIGKYETDAKLQAQKDSENRWKAEIDAQVNAAQHSAKMAKEQEQSYAAALEQQADDLAKYLAARKVAGTITVAQEEGLLKEIASMRQDAEIERVRESKASADRALGDKMAAVKEQLKLDHDYEKARAELTAYAEKHRAEVSKGAASTLHSYLASLDTDATLQHRKNLEEMVKDQIKSIELRMTAEGFGYAKAGELLQKWLDENKAVLAEWADANAIAVNKAAEWKAKADADTRKADEERWKFEIDGQVSAARNAAKMDRERGQSYAKALEQQASALAAYLDGRRRAETITAAQEMELLRQINEMKQDAELERLKESNDLSDRAAAAEIERINSRLKLDKDYAKAKSDITKYQLEHEAELTQKSKDALAKRLRELNDEETLENRKALEKQVKDEIEAIEKRMSRQGLSYTEATQLLQGWLDENKDSIGQWAGATEIAFDKILDWAAKAQEERVRGLVLAAKREAELNEWTYGQIADAIQRVLDAEEMSAKLRADLEYEVALNRKKAADKAAAEEARDQDARVKVRQQAVQRIAALEDWSDEQMADALQAILDEEEMSAELRIALEHEVAMARKSAAQEVAAAEEDAWALRQRLGLVTVQQVIQREAAVAEASQQSANARASAVGRLYDTIMQLADKAKIEELNGIRETMVALSEKWKAMGEGWELYVLVAEMAIKQIDGLIRDKESEWGKALADSILSNLGAVGDVIVSFQRNAATYDSPVKAFMMTLAEMVMKSRQFAALVDALNPIIEELIDMFGQLIAPLVPIVDILVRILTPVIRAVAAVFAWVADVIVGIYNAVAKVINALLGWLGVKIPLIEKTWRKDYDIDDGKSDKAGTQISEITGPSRDILVELLRPLRVLDSLPVYAASMEKAIYSMRDAFLAYASGQAAASGAAAAVVNNYYSINTIQIFSSGEEDFDQLMESLGRRADLALLGSGA